MSPFHHARDMAPMLNTIDGHAEYGEQRLVMREVIYLPAINIYARENTMAKYHYGAAIF